MDWGSIVLADGAWWTAEQWAAIRWSLLVGTGTVFLSLPPALAIGYGLARRKLPMQSLIEVLVNLPLVLPPVVTGYLLLILFRPGGWLGRLLQSSLGIQIAFDWKGLVVAAAVMSFPLMVRAVRLGFQSVDPRLEWAARTLGANRWRTFFFVSVPLARRGILAGCVLAFARSLSEFGATVMLVSQRESTRTIPLLVYSLRDRLDGERQLWPLVIISVLIAAVALAVCEWLDRQGEIR